jgi:hypothetical protein
MAEHTTRLLDQVAWDWQPLEPMIEHAALVIPPGKALRRYQRVRAAGEAKRTGEGPAKAPLTEAEQIKSGARSLVSDSVGTLRHKFIEVEQRGGVRWVRRKSQVAPGDRCPHCGRPGLEDESGPPGGPPTEDSGGSGGGGAGGGAVVVKFERRPFWPNDDGGGEALREAVEEVQGKDRPASEPEPGPGKPEPTLADAISGIAQLLDVVESQGRRIDAAMKVAQSAKHQAQATAMAVGQKKQRSRTRGGKEIR